MNVTNGKLIEKYFESNSLVEANIRSFNKFVDFDMLRIIKEVGDIVPTIIPHEMEDFRIKLDKIWITKPSVIEADGSRRDIYPTEARLRSITYSAPINIEISAHIDGVQRESFTTQIGKLPIMLKSKYCHLTGLPEEELIKKSEDPTDMGGYFVLNGNERVLIVVEDLAANKLFVEKSATGTSKFVGKVFSERGSYRVPHMIEQTRDGLIFLSFTRFKRIPIIPIIKALGMTKDSDIAQTISEEQQFDDVFINLYDSAELKTEKDALEYLSKKIGIQMMENKLDKTYENLDRYLLPHLGTDPKYRLRKAINLCKMIKRFLLVAKGGAQTMDKDHYMNKNLKLSGDLIGDLFRVNLRALVNDILYNFQRLVKRGKFQSLKIIIRDKLLTSRINSAMATGVWVGGRKGLSQNIDRTNYLASLSHLQRVVSLLSNTQENFAARALHPTHWGKLCLSKDTNILLADQYSQRTLETLQNCWNHHSVTTFDINSKNLVPSEIVAYSTSNPKLLGKKVYRLTSESGRNVIATEDHPFFTQHGWVNAGQLNAGDLVGVYPTLDPVEKPKLPTQTLGTTIVTGDSIRTNYPHRFNHYMKELCNNEMLPFTTNNYKIEIVARLLGHLLSDGSCDKRNIVFSCGSRTDAEKVQQDIRLLGFEPSKIMVEKTQLKKDNKTVYYTTYRVTKGGALHALFVQSGTPTGKRTDKEFSIPQWIFSSSPSVKREFLAGFMGGDGPKPRVQKRSERKTGSKPKISPIVIHKSTKYKKNLQEFACDLKKLFEEFAVTTSKITIKHDYTRKDGTPMLKCRLSLGESQENLKKLLARIGYRYCKQKEENANYISEWLRLRENSINNRIQLKRQVRALYEQGKTPKAISTQLGINYRVVNGWLFEAYKYKNTRLSQHHLPSFENWLEYSRIGSSGAIWERIISKEPTELDDVRDFTTKESTHSLIANGFITHNCAIETPEGTSIGLRKNLALLCDISQEEVNSDKIAKQLEQYGLKVRNG